MEQPSPVQEDAFVGRFLDQRVLENVLEFRNPASLADELDVLQFRKVPVQFTLRFSDCPEHPVKKAPADDRGQLEYLLQVFIQSIHASHDHALDGVGDADLILPIRAPYSRSRPTSGELMPAASRACSGCVR